MDRAGRCQAKQTLGNTSFSPWGLQQEFCTSPGAVLPHVLSL